MSMAEMTQEELVQEVLDRVLQSSTGVEDLETVTSLMRELKDDDPRYWQLAKALQRSLNTYDERDIAGTLEPAKEKLAGVLSEPAYSSVIHHVAVGHAHIDSAWL